MIIAVMSKSTRVKTQDVVTMTTACYYQLSRHLAPAWGRTPSCCVFADGPAHIPPGACEVYIFDHADQADALGYHDETPTGKPYGRVFVDPTFEQGGGALSGGSLSLSSVLSHEVCELAIDPLCNLWATATDGNDYAFEVCDPVENDVYNIFVGATPVPVSNFVYPSWFDMSPQVNARFDQLKALNRPFSMTPYGYMIKKASGEAQAVFGDLYPEWKRAGKAHAAARTARRLVNKAA